MKNEEDLKQSNSEIEITLVVEEPQITKQKLSDYLRGTRSEQRVAL